MKKVKVVITEVRTETREQTVTVKVPDDWSEEEAAGHAVELWQGGEFTDKMVVVDFDEELSGHVE